MPLPSLFCWSRFGTEAGESIEAILSRKNNERIANSGVFLWGIGNALTASMKQLVELENKPRVIFSPMRSTPKAVDVEPPCIVKWTAGVTLEGRQYELPSASIVTSRAPTSSRRTYHYALVCASTSQLELSPDAETIVFGELSNLLTGRPVGASQVTAIVQRTKGKSCCSTVEYPAAFEAELIYPFFIKLTDSILAEHDRMAAGLSRAVG